MAGYEYHYNKTMNIIKAAPHHYAECMDYWWSVECGALFQQ